MVGEVDVLLLVGQLVGRREEGDGFPGGEERQQVGGKELRHVGGSAAVD